MKHEQTFIPGTEPPPDPDRDEAIDAALDAWLEAQVEQKRAADTARIRHLSLLALLSERQIARYPYVERTTGRKRYAVVASDPRVKTVKQAAPKKERKKREKADADESVEVRHVSRETAEREVGPLDPFAATRAQMGGL